MVEGKLDLAVERVRDRNERGVCRIGAGDDPATSRSTARYATVTTFIRGSRRDRRRHRTASAASAVHAGLLGELAPRRLVQRFVGSLEASRNRPHALERSLAATHEQQECRSDIVRITMSTVTANAGNCDGSYATGVPRSLGVLVIQTITLHAGYGPVNHNRRSRCLPRPRGNGSGRGSLARPPTPGADPPGALEPADPVDRDVLRRVGERHLPLPARRADSLRDEGARRVPDRRTGRAASHSPPTPGRTRKADDVERSGVRRSCRDEARVEDELTEPGTHSM